MSIQQHFIKASKLKIGGSHNNGTNIASCSEAASTDQRLVEDFPPLSKPVEVGIADNGHDSPVEATHTQKQNVTESVSQKEVETKSWAEVTL